MQHLMTKEGRDKRGRDEPLVAIVTGGGRGIGKAMVLGLAAAGVSVVATAGREGAEVDAVAREVGQRYPEEGVLPLVADVTKEADCAAAVRATLKRFGRLDILVNNAGRGMRYVSEEFLSEPTRFWDVAPETWRLVVDTNVNGPFLMARAVVPVMLAAGWGRTVNVSVNRETMRRRGFSPYGPSKAALESETIIWAQGLSGSGITVNALLPGGATLTGMIPPSVSSELRSTLLDPSIMVDPLLWLISRAADDITGHRIIATEWQANRRGTSASDATNDRAGW